MTENLTDEDLERILSGAVSSVEAEMADDYEDSINTGERPDLATYDVPISLDVAKAIMLILRRAAQPDADLRAENERLRSALMHLRGAYDCADVVDAALAKETLHD